MNDIAGQAPVVLIAGASGGIGLATAELLGEGGACLGLQYRSNRARLDPVVEQFGEDRVVLLQADITDGEQCDRIVADVVDRFGGLDAYVHSVGATARYQRFLELADDLIEETLATELSSVIYSTRPALRQMESQGRGGRIVLVGSDSGKVGTTGEAISAACRAGIIGFAKSIAREHARDNILMNVVCPGPVITPLWTKVQDATDYSQSVAQKIVQATPMRRAAEAREIAEAIAFLTAPAASFITGQAISVSGGLTMA